MKIERKIKKDKIIDLDVGEVFVFQNQVYMKIELAQLYNNNHINAVNLRNGMIEFFDNMTLIEHINEATIKI